MQQVICGVFGFTFHSLKLDFFMHAHESKTIKKTVAQTVRVCLHVMSLSTTRSMRAPLQGTPKCEPPPKERVGIIRGSFELLG